MNQKIYTIQIQMTCQDDCNRMKQICVDYKLRYWKSSIAFQYWYDTDVFEYSEIQGFGIYSNQKLLEPITIEQFLELLNEK